MMAEKITPYFTTGTVIKGFGRGSKSLGIPTANFGPEVVENLPNEIQTGVYYGWASVNNGSVYQMVMSIGWNPYFRNKQKSMETHIIHKFEQDFYGEQLRVCMLGYIRPEKNFDSLDELISCIQNDITIAKGELEKPDLKAYRLHPYFHEET